MKHAGACMALLCLTITEPLAAGESAMTKDAEAVRAVVEEMTAAFQDGRIDAVMEAYEPGAAILFEPGEPLTERAAVREAFGQWSAVNPVFDYAGHEVVVAGDIALHVAPWEMTGRTPDGQEVRQSGLSVAVLRRQPDGSWKMAIDNPHGARLIAGD